MKKETIEEFLARGGKITRVAPVQQQEAQAEPIRVKTQLTYDVVSLGDGELLFGETRTRAKVAKPVSKEEYHKLIDAANLPSHIVEALKKAVKNV